VTSDAKMATCGQCGKPAIFNVDGHPVCVDCNLKIQQAFQIRDNAAKQQINFLLDQADAITGLTGVFGRYHLQNPLVQGPVAFHSINVDRSVVGSINTGTVEKMEVALNNIHVYNQNEQLEHALREFAEAIIGDKSLAPDAKDEIIEQLSLLAAQAATKKESRTMIMMKALVRSIGTSIPAALIEHWDKIRVLIGA